MQIKQRGYGETPQAVDYWVHHRSSLAELYESERHFFVPAAQTAKKVLDIGCAAGGSALFTREVNPELEYTGVDVSPESILAANQRFSNLPNTKFLHFDGNRLPVADESVDFSFSFGVFHH